jgi:hypothetical protein
VVAFAGKEYLPGSHSFNIDGTRLNRGVYYYTVNANGSAQTKKMILIK